jgi:flagellar biosynthesis GTPase FlhF
VQAGLLAVVLFAGLMAARMPWPGQGTAPSGPPQPVARPLSEQVPQLTAADQEFAGYLDNAVRLMRDKRYEAARDVLEKAREVKSSDEALRLRLNRISDENERAAAAHAARVAQRASEAAPVSEAAKADVAKADAAKADAAKADAAKADAAKADAAKADAAKADAAKADAAKAEATKVEAAKVEATKVEAAKAEAAKVQHERVAAKEAKKASPAVAEADPHEVGRATEAAAPPRPSKDVAQPSISAGRPPPPVPDPRTHLPAVYRVKSAAELARVCSNIEGEVTSVASVSAEITSGATAELQRELAKLFDHYKLVEFYPRSMYLFMVNEAAQGRDRAAIARKLKDAHLKGTFRAWASR